MKNLLKNKSNYFVFLFFWGLGFIAYRNTFNIFIPSDNASPFYFFDQYGIDGLKEHFRTAEPFWVSNNALYIFLRLFGTNSFYWIGLSIVFHVVISFLVYRVCSCVQKLFLPESNKWLSFFSGLLFLISPYQTEAVIWEPSNLGILLSTLFILTGTFFVFQYFISAKLFHLLLIHVFFLLAVFSWESSLFFPATCLLTYFFFRKKNKNSFSFENYLLKIFFPQAGFIFSYFLLCKLQSGYWLWHGGETLNISFSPFIYIGNVIKYSAKFFLLYRYLHLEAMDNALRQIYTKPFLLTGLYILFGAILTLAVYFTKKNSKTIFLIFLFLCFIISLSPVLPLDSSFLKYIYPDRYGYLPSAFFYIFLTACVFFIFRKFAFPFLLGVIILFWVLLAQTISVWNDVNDYCSQVIQNFEPFLNYDRVYVLNIPSYYKGIAAFRADFPKTIFFHYHKKQIQKIRVIAGSYVETSADSLLSVRIKHDSVFVVGPKKTNPFFSYYASWAHSYQTDDYTVEFDSLKCSYLFRFKNGIPKNSAFIYTSNGKWKKAE